MAKKTVTAKEVIEMSHQHGLLAKQLYVLFTTPINGIEPIFANVDDHLAYQRDLEKQGIMFAAGPNWTDDEQFWEGDGMFVIRAGSIAEARAIADRDPMHQRGVRRYTVRPWMINEGSFSVTLNYSSGKFSLA